MECGQRMQQGQGQGIHRIEYLYCGVTRTCPRETQGTGIGTGPDYPETDPETCFRERHRNAYIARYHAGWHQGNETLAGIDYSPVTINRYKNVVKKLQRLIPSYYGKEDITFHELTPEFIRAFDIYLKTEGGLCRNTIVRYMKCFKKFTNMALAKEWMRKNPFYGYKMEQDETDPVFLTYDELQAVMKKKFTIPRLELVRDIFVFACFTFLALIDNHLIIKVLKRVTY